jgi:hypothetical protein
MLIGLSHGPAGTYLVCKFTNPEAGPGHYDWNEHDEDNTVLVQSDWDFPGLATSFGWNHGIQKHCHHEGTDGTVDCKKCGKKATKFITEASDFLDKCVNNATVVNDPGYFEEND